MRYQYRFKVPARNGLGLREHVGDDLDRIKQAHPEARITVRQTLNDSGRVVADEEWSRKLAAEANAEKRAASEPAPVPAETPVSTTTTTTTTTTPAPAKAKSK